PGMQLSNIWLHGFVSGFLASGGDARAGMMGMLSAGIAGEIGLKDLNHFDRALAHGVTQGAISAAGGGRFGDGALGAFSGSLLSFIPEAVAGPYGTGGEGAKIGRMVAAAAVGGTVSKIGGGKFANGAWSAAFVSRFNHDHETHVFRSMTVAGKVYEVAYHSDGFGERACGRNAECASKNLDLDTNHPKTKEWQDALHAQGVREVGAMLSVSPIAGPTLTGLGVANRFLAGVRVLFGDFGGALSQLVGTSMRFKAIQHGIAPANATRIDAATGTALDHAWTEQQR
ncbi:MAG TPA: hypothetical protein PK205_18415, partial [Promineifilum sp.]|nr:hypothetical protein [Promineifilum sp.]